MTPAAASSFLALGSSSAAMCCVAAALLLLALGTSALAEPVHFKDCGESRARRTFRALGGSLRRHLALRPELGGAGPRRRPGSASDPAWSGSVRAGEKVPSSRKLAHPQLCLCPWNARVGSLDVPGDGWTFCRSFLKFAGQTPKGPQTARGRGARGGEGRTTCIFALCLG